MRRYIELNNETFEIKKVKGELHPITVIRGLGNCYAKPSKVKRIIYNKWLNWYMNCKFNQIYSLRHFTIDSFNVNMFTLKIDVYDRTNGKFIGQLYITKTRQEFWTI